jgi:Carboxypeptidase regulatory-like domain
MSRSSTARNLFPILLVIAGCADHPVGTFPETPTTGTDRATVTGRVVDVAGVPLVGASVSLRSIDTHATTDATGAFSLDVPANTTLTLTATAPSMATTLVQQFLMSPNAHTAFEITVLTPDHVKNLAAMGTNAMGGVIAIAVKSLSGAPVSAGATLELTPDNLGKVLYAPQRPGMPDPDPTMMALVPGSTPIAWALGVQPHVTIMKLSLHGVTQAEPPYAIDDVIWPGTFTVDPGSLTLLTLFTP